MPVIVIRATAPKTNVFPILLLHEITGLSPACLDFAERLAERGPFVVYVPQMFGRTNELGWWPALRNFAYVGFSCQWHTILSRRTSPRYFDIEPLSQRISEENHGADIGVIGMCLTGSWPLALMADPQVRVGALCQPAVPFCAWTKIRKRDLSLSDRELKAGIERIRKDRLTLLGFRFSNDNKSTADRFMRIKKLFGTEGRFVDGTICSSEYGENIAPDAHSVFCGDYCDNAGHPTRVRLDQLIREFRDALEGKSQTTKPSSLSDHP